MQSNIIFAYLFVAFVIYITMRGELPTYLGFLLSGDTGSSGGGLSVAAAPDVTHLNLAQSNSDPAANAAKVADLAKLFL